MKAWTDEQCEALLATIGHRGITPTECALIRAAVDEARREEREAMQKLVNRHFRDRHPTCSAYGAIISAILARSGVPRG